MENYAFCRILVRFSSGLGWCALLGFLGGLVYRFGNDSIRQTILDAIGEHSALITFNAIGTLSLVSLGGAVTICGRTGTQVSRARTFLCYRPAELVLSLGAVFFGLWLGFIVGQLPTPDAKGILTVWVVAFLVTVGSLMFLLWASFEGNGRFSECTARLVAAVVSVVGIGVFWWTYVR